MAELWQVARFEMLDARTAWRTACCTTVLQVMAALRARLALDVVTRGGEGALPGPLAAGGGEVLRVRAAEFDPAGAACDVVLVLGPNALEVRGEFDLHGDGHHRRAIPVALAAPDGDLVAAEVDVLHAAGSIRAGRPEP